MGSVGFAMPLLSTLAALVIIVHSAEENYEREQNVLRSRALETGTSDDQSWRMAGMQPIMAQTRQVNPRETWGESDPEQIILRRRVRKRKRRPHLADEDDIVPQERVYTNSEESQTQVQENVERPRRRRKKMEFQNPDDKDRKGSWNEEENRPKRRRGQKRKRLSAQPWPELSEFGVQREQTDSSTENTDKKLTPFEIVQGDKKYNQNIVNEKSNSKVQSHVDNKPDIEITTKAVINNDGQSQIDPKYEDISLSEFSIESDKHYEIPNKTTTDIQGKIKETGYNNIEPPKEPLDSYTLKALLRRSNGKSLSEILQQNNLSLADLLHGKEKALSILKKESLSRTQDLGQSRHSNTNYNNPINSMENSDTFDKKYLSKSEKEENEYVEIETTTSVMTTEHNAFDYKDNNTNEQEEYTGNSYQEDNTDGYHRRGYLRRRFPGGIRRKLRTRPNEISTYKGQLSRDLIALTSLKYKNNRNISKSREWKEIIPSMLESAPSKSELVTQKVNDGEMITTTPCPYTETTPQELGYETTTDLTFTSINTEPIMDLKDEQENIADSKTTYLELEGIDIAQFTTTNTPFDVNTEHEKENITPQLKPLPVVKPLMHAYDLRRQALHNRSRRKRIKQKISPTEIPEELELEVKDTFGIGKFVSASEFFTKTQTRTTKTIDDDDFTTLEDYLTTEAPVKIPNRHRTKKPPKIKSSTTFTIQKIFVTTEETAKYEIEEILSDNLTGAKLSKILKDRNMTLKELIEHRERGSSHVHLADIFHNASKEPNPPEPFLSKSLIEPISKETYPLRALLEANLLDPRTTTIDPSVSQINNAYIPIVMDFGNNVNENGENKGVISMFNKSESNSEYQSTKTSYNTKDITTNINTDGSETSREARMLNSDKDSVTWNDLINLMQKNHQKDNKEDDNSLGSDLPIKGTIAKIDLEEDIDGDGLIVLNDLQQLRNMERKTTPEKMLEMKLYERNKPVHITNESYTVLSDTKSVTVATASIIGLALILFLLTYAILKWRQQIRVFDTKHANEDEFVPTPVFESRKGHKINSSTRSKSPMLATSNIYSIDTIETRAGSESPEYMWDTLRKPFQ